MNRRAQTIVSAAMWASVAIMLLSSVASFVGNAQVACHMAVTACYVAVMAVYMEVYSHRG